jgi:SAM-dependent methyltransferase
MGFRCGPVENLVNGSMQKERDAMQKAGASEFDAYDQTYDDTVNRAIAFTGLTVDFFTRAKVEYFVELIEALRPPAVRADVIDVGCGVAIAHPLLAGRIGRLVGVDVSTACIAKAVDQNPANEYKPFDGLNLPYPDESFDAASAVCVFHHVPIVDRVRLAMDVRRVLRSGGLFAIFEHNPLNPLTMHVVNNCEFDKNAILLRKQETERLLGEAGFRDISTRFILTIPAAGRILRTVDRLFSRIPLGGQYFAVGRA